MIDNRIQPIVPIVSDTRATDVVFYYAIVRVAEYMLCLKTTV